MGFYKLQAKAFNGKPAYKYHSDSFGDAFLYFENLKSTEEYWVVGDKLGSAKANLGVADQAGSPDQVRARLPTRQTPEYCAGVGAGVSADPVSPLRNRSRRSGVSPTCGMGPSTPCRP
jgi:hypothetical protein